MSTVRPLTITTNGNAQISTSQSKFGGSSGYFDGTGDYLSIANSTGFGFGTGDFTLEVWVYQSANNGQENIFDFRTTAIDNAVVMGVRGGNSPYVYINGGYRIQSSTGITLSSWNHVAYVRQGTTGTLYLNGNSVGSWTDNIDYGSSAPLKIGAGYTGTFTFWTEYLDEIRISSTARYTSNFTPPAASFVNDDNTLLLLHMDGTDGSTTFEDDDSESGVTHEGAATLTASATQTATVGVLKQTDADLDTTTTQTVTAGKIQQAGANFTGAFTPVLTAVAILRPLVFLETDFDLESTASATKTDSALLEYFADLQSQGDRFRAFDSDFDAQFDTTADAARILNNDAELAAFFATSANTQRTRKVDSDLDSAFGITATISHTQGVDIVANSFATLNASADKIKQTSADLDSAFAIGSAVQTRTAVVFEAATTKFDTGLINQGVVLDQIDSRNSTSPIYQTQQSASLAIGTGDFTLEFYYRDLAPAQGTSNSIILSDLPGTEIKLIFGSNFSNFYLYNLQIGQNLYPLNIFLTGGYDKITLQKTDNVYDVYFNGIKTSTFVDLEDTGLTTSTRLKISLDSIQKFIVDELRISNVARYTANYTVSQTAFENDSNTLALFHFDGDMTDDVGAGGSSETVDVNVTRDYAAELPLQTTIQAQGLLQKQTSADLDSAFAITATVSSSEGTDIVVNNFASLAAQAGILHTGESTQNATFFQIATTGAIRRGGTSLNAVFAQNAINTRNRTIDTDLDTNAILTAIISHSEGVDIVANSFANITATADLIKTVDADLDAVSSLIANSGLIVDSSQNGDGPTFLQSAFTLGADVAKGTLEFSVTLDHILDNPNFTPSTSDFDQFGSAVGINGNYAVVGAPNEDIIDNVTISAAGVVYMFDVNTGNLLYTKSFPNPNSNNRFGQNLAIGETNFAASRNGANRVYVYNNATGNLVREFVTSGSALAIDSTRLYVGDQNNVEIWDVASGNLVNTITSPDTEASFGYTISVKDGNILVGDHGYSNNLGRVYLYNSSGVLQQTYDNPSQSANRIDDRFGFTVNWLGDNVLITAYRADGDIYQREGKAYIYDTSGNLLHTIDNPNYSGDPVDSFGFYASADQNYSVIYGGDDIVGSVVYIFDAQGNLKTTVENPNVNTTSTSDNFGRSAIDGNKFIVSASGEDDDTGVNQGKAYIYTISENFVETIELFGEAALNSTFTQSADVSRTRTAMASVAVTADLTAAVSRTRGVDSDLDNVFAVDASAQVFKTANAELDTTANVTATISHIEGADIVLSNFATVEIVALAINPGSADLTATAQLDITVGTVKTADADLNSALTIAVDTTIAKTATAELDSAFDVTSTGEVLFGTAAQLDTNSTLEFDGAIIVDTTAAINSTSELTADTLLTKNALAQLASQFGISAESVTGVQTTATLASEFEVTAILKTIVTDRTVYTIPRENRVYTVPRENRIYTLPGER